MSRVAKSPVEIPSGVEVIISAQAVAVKGAKGSLKMDVHERVEIKREDKILKFAPRDESIEANAMAGTTRALVNNLIVGAVNGFSKKLDLVGVGYRAQMQGKVLNLTLGHSHPISFTLPDGIAIETPSQTEIVVKGIDKQLVGEVAAKIRAYRKVEPYKGKGVKYSDEIVVRKEVKKK
ncbi:MAG: 50S ribosomal protein L6 [Gammaproteobacteria bacterium]|nr:50S ribosomal protein L6 [Gammaproteobacteria bacterium]